ncbi:MAG: DUF6157 family protein [Devosia sp.]
MSRHTTNYFETFISLSPDSPIADAVVPPKPGTVAAMQHERLLAAPYSMTSDDLIFGIFADRSAIPEEERGAARMEYFSKGQPCLRSSPLVKTYGWGLHYDEQGRIALVGSGGPADDEMQDRPDLKQLLGMRSKRAGG